MWVEELVSGEDEVFSSANECEMPRTIRKWSSVRHVGLTSGHEG